MSNFFIGMFLSTLITAMLTTRLLRLIIWYAFNSLFLALAAMSEAVQIQDEAMLLSALLTLILKSALIPYTLKHFALKFKAKRHIPPSIKVQYLIILIPAILVFTFYLLDPLINSSSKNYISLAVASLFLSLVLVIEHKNIFAKVIGFLSLENALFLLAMTATEGMPMLVELGIFVDLLMAVVVLNLLFKKEVPNV